MMSLAMILLLGFFLITGVMVTSDVTNSATPSRHQKMTTTSTATATSPMMTEQRRVFDFERLQANLDHRQHRQHQRQQQQKQRQQSTTDRRVIPWVSIAVLLNILFFFRSIAAPFFDPLVSNTYNNCSPRFVGPTGEGSTIVIANCAYNCIIVACRYSRSN
jgi:biopolymer transport protein ExbD